MTTPQWSTPPLTSRQQYQYEIAQLGTLTPEQEDVLVQNARNGDIQARHTLVEQCLHYVEFWAGRYVSIYGWESWRIEYSELVSVGNLALLERLDKALCTDGTVGYLKATAKHTMKLWLMSHRSLVSKDYHQQHISQPDIQVESYDVPAYETSDETRIARENFEDHAPEPAKNFEALYQAFDALTPKQREAIKRRYGLDEYAPESFVEMAGSTSSKQAMHCMVNDALVKLRVVMPSPESSYRVCSGSQAAQKLGKSYDTFKDIARKYGVKPIFPRLYLEHEIERLVHLYQGTAPLEHVS